MTGITQNVSTNIEINPMVNQQPNNHTGIFKIFSNNFKLILSLMLLLISVTGMYAQEIKKPRHFGIHAGLNFGVLDAGSGLSLSFHYAFNTQKVLQPEIALAYDAQKGETFSNGDNYKSSALSLYGGLRLNLRPKKNWNPSLYLMPGLMFESDQTSRADEPGREGTSLGAQLGLSNTFGKKHMITIGYYSGTYTDGVHLKYGFLF